MELGAWIDILHSIAYDERNEMFFPITEDSVRMKDITDAMEKCKSSPIEQQKKDIY